MFLGLTLSNAEIPRPGSYILRSIVSSQTISDFRTFRVYLILGTK